MASVDKNPAGSTLEGICREVEYMARGHVAHEADVILQIARALRRLALEPDADSRTPDQVLERVEARLNLSIENQREHNERLVELCRERARSVDLSDPLEPYSDKDKWWPRNTMTEDQRLAFYYAKNPEKRPRSQASWANANPYGARVHVR